MIGKITQAVFCWPWRVITYVFRMISWLWSIPVVQVFVAAAVFSSLSFLFSNCVERKIRICGMVLQLLGAGTVIFSLLGAQRAFEDLLPLKRLRQLWSKRPRFSEQPRVISAAGLSAGVSGGGARMRVDLSPDAALPDRVKMLEQKFNSLFDEVGALDAQLKAAKQKFSQDLQSEQRERKRGDQNTREQLKRAIAESLVVQLFGATLLIIGIIMATASPEIASYLGYSSVCSEPYGSPEWSVGVAMR
jgi:hypothetical protein